MKGYKAFNKDMTCRGFQYEVGKTYHMDGKIKPCERGFHFCQTIADCYKFYSMSDDTLICEVESGDNVLTDDGVKWVTNEITIIATVDDERRKKGNLSTTSTGYCNTGDRNTGDRNTGDRNTGNCNTGYCNTGNWNTGNRNTGDRNTGNWNTGNCNTGCFCTLTPTIRMFDVETDWTFRDWINSEAYHILCDCPTDRIIETDNAIKKIVITDEERQRWWDALPQKAHEACIALPNFDPDKFCKCIGIKHL